MKTTIALILMVRFKPPLSFEYLFCCLVVLLQASPAFSDTRDEEPPPGFVPMTNNIDLSGWHGVVADPNKRAKMTASELQLAQESANKSMLSHWKIVDRVLEFDGSGDSIATDKEYGNFEMYVDWKILANGDSGIYLRGIPQVQIWDPNNESMTSHGAYKGSGGLWNNKTNVRFPIVRADRPIGEWNTFYIKMVDDRVTVRLNGELVVDEVPLENYWKRGEPIPQKGPIELQNHGNKLWFRNLYIREIEDLDRSDSSE